jgi:hypothetical protein
MPDRHVPLLGIFAFQRLARFAPGDVNRIHRHARANLARVDHCFLLRRQRVVSAELLLPPGFDRRRGASDHQQQNEKRRSHD